MAKKKFSEDELNELLTTARDLLESDEELFSAIDHAQIKALQAHVEKIRPKDYEWISEQIAKAINEQY